MDINVNSNAGDVSRWVRNIMRDQAPFAISSAINATAKQAQAAQREHMGRVFTIRRKSFVDRSIKIKPFATKGEPFAVLRVDPPGGQERAEIITRHEQDRERTPDGRSLAVPAQQGRARIVRRRSNPLHPSKWKMKRVDKGRSRFEVYQGRQGLYMIRRPDGSGAVFQRTDGGNSVPVFWLQPRTPLDPDLNFVENIERIVADNWGDNITAAWDRALRTAR